MARLNAAATGAAALVLLLALSAPGHASARLENAVTDWINATQAEVAISGIQNQLSAKVYALVALPILQALETGGAPDAVLVAYAGHAALSALFPWRQGNYDVLLAKQLKAAGLSADDKKAATSAAVAKAVPLAADLVRARTADESTRYSGFTPAAAGTPYEYQFVEGQKYALYPQLADATPFVLDESVIDAVVSNKNASTGPVFKPAKDDYLLTYELGGANSPDRSEYNTGSAWFWADGANTSAITGHWIDIAREVLPSDFSLKDTALYFARAAAATYDASIAGWKVKYSTLHWRPVTAITQGWTNFTADPAWKPLLGRTPAHPEYPSGHQVSVGAALEVLVRTLGTDNVTFSIGSEGAPWLGKRKYKTLTAAAEEVGDSRLFGGVHFTSANDDGLKLGRLIAGKAFDAWPGATGSIKAASASGGGGGAKTESAAGGDKKASKASSSIFSFILGRRLLL
ncbi:hypothetical protein HT031_004330 [Scenedesmus sp. PABB004]|nr:hypothetical protein HT031_004330 [Scenedesmus sp. PABB004]